VPLTGPQAPTIPRPRLADRVRRCDGRDSRPGSQQQQHATTRGRWLRRIYSSDSTRAMKLPSARGAWMETARRPLAPEGAECPWLGSVEEAVMKDTMEVLEADHPRRASQARSALCLVL